jgi:hypothetical protein
MLKLMMRIFTAVAVAIIVTAAVTVLFYFYIRLESPYKARMEGLAVKLPTWIEWRIKIHDWIANYWYLAAMGVFLTTLVVTAIGLNRGDNVRE